jgi:DNA-binding transcriptional LysR family regulator
MPLGKQSPTFSGTTNDINGHYVAVHAGVGVAGLPCFIGMQMRGFSAWRSMAKAFSRNILLVVHRDLKRSPPIRAVMDFLAEVIEGARALQQIEDQYVKVSTSCP